MVDYAQALRYVVLRVPNWKLSSLVVEVPPGAPAAVLHRSRVQTATPAARECGVQEGMSQVMAQYLCPHLLMFSPDEDRDSAAFEAVLDVFDQMAAGVVAIRPGLAFAPARGAAKWAGGEEALAQELVEQVALVTGAECQVGIASTLSAALVASFTGLTLPVDNTERFLDQQKIDTVLTDFSQGQKSLLMEDLRVLAGLGVETVGQLRALGLDAIATRFSAAGPVLVRLLRGQDIHMEVSPRSMSAVSAQVEIDPPAHSSEHAMLAIRRVCNTLADNLVARGLYSSTVQITLRRVSGQVVERTWTLLDATSPTQVGKRVTWQIRGMGDSSAVRDTHAEGWGIWGRGAGGGNFGRSVTAEAEPLEEFALEREALQHIELNALNPAAIPEMDTLWGGAHNLRRAGRAVEEVQMMLGEDAVVIPTVHGGYDPRTRVSFVPWGSDVPPRESGGAGVLVDAGLPVSALPNTHCAQGLWEGGVSQPPIVLFSHAPPALLMGQCEDGTLGRILVDQRGTLRGNPTHLLVKDDRGGLAAGDYPLTTVEALWVVRGRWWREVGEEHRPRCYLRVGRTEGPDFLLVQKGGHWWVEGTYPEEETGRPKYPGKITWKQ